MNNRLHPQGSTAIALQSRLFQNAFSVNRLEYLELLVRSFRGMGWIGQNLRFFCRVSFDENLTYYSTAGLVVLSNELFGIFMLLSYWYLK